MAASTMTFSSSPASVDPRSGFCAETKTFYSLRPYVPLPSPSLPLSFPSYAFSLLPCPLPSHPAFIDASTGDTISYPQFLSQVTALSANLVLLYSISKGDVILVASPPRLELLVLYMSLLSIGAVMLPLNPAYTPSEISRFIDPAKPSLAFTISSLCHKLPSSLNVIRLDTPHFKNLLETTPTNVERMKQVEVRQSDLAVIMYSSGTTGRAKATALSHRYCIATAGRVCHIKKGTSHREVTLTTTPLFHSMGFAISLEGIAAGGTTVILTAKRITVADIVQAAKRYEVTQITLAPPVVETMANSDDLSQQDFPALETVISGGARLHVKSARRFMEKFPQVLLSLGYGSTEGGGISRIKSRKECDCLKSVGRLSEYIQVKIVDPDTNRDFSVGQAGELLLKSPSCMIGYIGDDEANAAAFDSNGWLKTGDLCYIDQDGFLYVVDRLKDLFKYKGYQISPGELELVLNSHPDVVDAAVTPIPHDEFDQIPVALVVRQDTSNLSETDVIDYVAKKVASHKHIYKVLFVDKIPKSPAGKILRRELPYLYACQT